MKAYVCDACGVTITDPYKAKMREFYVSVKFDYGYAFSRDVKTCKQKVHLCDDCYHALHEIAGAKWKGGEG